MIASSSSTKLSRFNKVGTKGVHSCQPVTIKNRDKIHEKVGLLVKNRDILKIMSKFLS